MKDSEEKRKYPRVELILKITYTSTKDFVADYTSNASGGGVFIATGKSFQIGEDLSFSISFPGILSPIECHGVVRWQRAAEEATADKPAGIGVAFSFDSEEQAAEVQDLVDQLSAPPAPEEAPVEAGEEPAKPFRVLLVEDNRVVREMVRFALQKFHHARHARKRNLELEEAEDGNEAWNLVQQKTFDLAVVDMYMPVMDGAELILRIRQDAISPNMPIVAISTGDEDTQKAAHTAGADFFLPKPVKLNQLFESLHRLLGLGPKKA
jgi:uncharacterized protein (TIGR02266 family)